MSSQTQKLISFVTVIAGRELQDNELTRLCQLAILANTPSYQGNIVDTTDSLEDWVRQCLYDKISARATLRLASSRGHNKMGLKEAKDIVEFLAARI